MRRSEPAVRRLTETQLTNLLRTMLRIRRFEEKVAKLFKKGDVLPGFVHLYLGEEAVAAGVCALLEPYDCVTSTHRGHGHLIAKGADISRMMAELLGRSDGYCRGKGGSMHIVDFEHRNIGTNGIVGGGIPMGIGSAWANKHLGRNCVTVVFFGDGASNQGVFLEGMNLAAIWKLPVVFVCENNLYTQWTLATKLVAGRIADRGNAFGIPGTQVDGNDVLAVYDLTAKAVERARAGEGPSLIEALTYRHHGHNEGEEAFSGNYRPAEEIAEWLARDPILRFTDYLLREGVLTAAGAKAIDQEEVERVAQALAFAESSPWPDPEEAYLHVFAEGSGGGK